MRRHALTEHTGLWVGALVGALALAAPAPPALGQVNPVRTLAPGGVEDADDMAFWIHPSDRSKSLIIISDKSAGRIFVMDPSGELLQEVRAGEPGNIDVRYDFPLGGSRVDIVGFNDRESNKLLLYRVDARKRTLARVDDDGIVTRRARPNYSFALCRSWRTGKFYALASQEGDGTIEQFELAASGGKITGEQVRTWKVGDQAEGMVCDDELGSIFVAEEDEGVWKLGLEPDSPTPGRRVDGMGVGENGLRADVEGVAIFHQNGGGGFIVVSNQGRSDFRIFQRKPPHRFVGAFSISGVRDTDGVDVTPVAIGREFPAGALAAHNGRRSPYGNVLVSWKDIMAAVSGLSSDPSWDPREVGGTTASDR